MSIVSISSEMTQLESLKQWSKGDTQSVLEAKFFTDPLKQHFKDTF